MIDVTILVFRPQKRWNSDKYRKKRQTLDQKSENYVHLVYTSRGSIILYASMQWIVSTCLFYIIYIF